MRTFHVLLLILPLVLGGCLRPAPPAARLLQDQVVAEDTVWSGAIIIAGKVEVMRGATLTIAPGTDISFRYQDKNRDGLGDGTLVVKGELLAIGTPQQPIRFHSARANPQPGDWLEIAVDFSRRVHLRYCELRDSAYTLHAHFTQGIVEDCHIHDNIDGCRIGQAIFVLRHNLIEYQTGKGINFRNSRVTIHDNLIRNNAAGIFLFENDQPFTISENNFVANSYHLRLGDFYFRDVELQGNWWGTVSPAEIRPLIYDRQNDPEIGRVTLQPAPQPIPGAGPRLTGVLDERWQFMTGGFVDAAPLLVGERAFYPSWDGRLYALNGKGQPVWVAELGDVSDAAPASDGERIFVQTWQREVVALRLTTGQELWRYQYPESPADDHRQGGLQVVSGKLLVPAWNGRLYALQPRTGELLWQYDSGAALRAAPFVADGQIYLPASDGVLHCLDLQGVLVWKRNIGASLLTTPAQTPQGLALLTKAGTVVALDRSGAELWRRELNETCYYAAPVVSADSLYVATAAGRVHALSVADGNNRWQVETQGAVYATPLVSRGRIFVEDNAGYLFALSTAGGDLLARAFLGEPLQSPPVLFGSLLLVGSRDRSVHAFQVDF